MFNNPALDDTSLLNIWNVNKFTGVVGVFNCEGAGWCKVEKKTHIHNTDPGLSLERSALRMSTPLLSLLVRTGMAKLSSTATNQVPDLSPYLAVTSRKLEENGVSDDNVIVVTVGELIRLRCLYLTLKVVEYKLFHVSPLKEINCHVFCAHGLLNMFNSGGAVEQFDIKISNNSDNNLVSDAPNALSDERAATSTVAFSVRGCSQFGAYSSQKPIKCRANYGA